MSWWDHPVRNWKVETGGCFPSVRPVTRLDLLLFGATGALVSVLSIVAIETLLAAV